MTEEEALDVVRDRAKPKRRGADAELEEAISTLEKAIERFASIEGIAISSMLTFNEDDRIFNTAFDVAESVRDEDVRECLNEMGSADLARSSSEDDFTHAIVSTVHDILLSLTDKDSERYWNVIEECARCLIADAADQSKKE